MYKLLPTLFIALALPTLGLARTVTVDRVIDGDTFVTTDNEHVRLIGVDTPEASSDDCYAQKAKTYLESLILGETVNLKFDEDKYDQYDRTLAYVYSNGSINRKLLGKGYAFVYTVQPNDLYESKYLVSQADAQKDKKGIWGHCKSIIKDHKPSQVSGLTFSDITQTGVTIAWDEADLARSYKLTITPENGSAVDFTGHKYNYMYMSGLSAGTTYDISVRAKNYLGYGKTSSMESFTTTAEVVEEETEEENTGDDDQSSDIICSSNVYNCSDFSTQADAQEVHDYCMATVGSDIHELDSDDDGEACESLN